MTTQTPEINHVHQFWRDSNPSGCFTCGKTREEIGAEYFEAMQHPRNFKEKEMWEEQFNRNFLVITIISQGMREYLNAVALAPEFIYRLKDFIRTELSLARAEGEKLGREKLREEILTKLPKKNKVRQEYYPWRGDIGALGVLLNVRQIIEQAEKEETL